VVARYEHRHVEAVLPDDLVGHAEPVEQRAVGRAAPEEDVLAVVDFEGPEAERRRQATEAGRASTSVTVWPASARRSAAVIPASPPPTTPIRITGRPR
jgi:hypothetical protein